jgi:Kef-type K+ transport system membrane component KefB
MTVTIIITFCALLLIAYLFDLTSARTKIPSVILLLILGWLVRQTITFFDTKLPDFSSFLPVLGTFGIILIVLEGSLMLELNKSKFGLIRQSFIGALLPMLGLALSLGFLFSYFGGFDFKNSIANVIPLCVISSAIAIPSVSNLSKKNREFVIYESSISDILGVLLFNFVALNKIIDLQSFGYFGLQLLIIFVVSFVATIALSVLLNEIEHHVKFVPIILLIVLIYEISKIYHLPGLIFILLFGLFIGNLDELRHIRWIERFKPVEFNKEVLKFRDLTMEAAFLVRALFFLLFGYLIETSEILNPDTFLWAVVIVIFIFGFRALQLKISKIPLSPLLFVAPRGLITILLFLSIDPEQVISIVNKSLIIQVIAMTALLMMFGLMINKSTEKSEAKKEQEEKERLEKEALEKKEQTTTEKKEEPTENQIDIEDK